MGRLALLRSGTGRMQRFSRRFTYWKGAENKEQRAGSKGRQREMSVKLTIGEWLLYYLLFVNCYLIKGVLGE
jgi:hypothetical protein